MLFLLIDIMTLLNLDLISDDKIFFFFLVIDRFCSFSLKELNLGFCIKLINLYSGDFIIKVLQFDFLFFNINANFMSLLDKIISSFFYGCVFGFLID